MVKTYSLRDQISGKAEKEAKSFQFSILIEDDGEIETAEALGGFSKLFEISVLRLGVATNNNRIYRIEEASSIVEKLKNLPIYFGASFLGEHVKENKIGEVVDSWLDEAKNTIKAKIRVFGELAKRIRRGFGVSIGGVVDKLRILRKGSRVLYEVVGMQPSHVQLLEPFTPKGDDQAQVLGETSEESKMLDDRELSEAELSAVMSALKIEGEI